MVLISNGAWGRIVLFFMEVIPSRNLVRIPYWERSHLGELIPDILTDLQQNHIHP